MGVAGALGRASLVRYDLVNWCFKNGKTFEHVWKMFEHVLFAATNYRFIGVNKNRKPMGKAFEKDLEMPGFPHLCALLQEGFTERVIVRRSSNRSGHRHRKCHGLGSQRFQRLNSCWIFRMGVWKEHIPILPAFFLHPSIYPIMSNYVPLITIHYVPWYPVIYRLYLYIYIFH